MLMVKTKNKFVHIVCIKMAVNSKRRKILLFLSTNMAAMTSHANDQIIDLPPNVCIFLDIVVSYFFDKIDAIIWLNPLLLGFFSEFCEVCSVDLK